MKSYQLRSSPTKSPRAAKRSFTGLTSQSKAVIPERPREDVETILKEKVLVPHTVSAHIPKLSSSYHKSQYRFKARKPDLAGDSTATPVPESPEYI